MIEIRHRGTGNALRTVDADTLKGADLCEADLRGADLRGADLRGADLWFADLRRADLRGANLKGANLRNADLRGAMMPNGLRFEAWVEAALSMTGPVGAAGEEVTP